MGRDTLQAVRGWLVSLALVAAGACSDTGGCATTPLPEGGLPATQTVEGGAQIRITRQGFQKLTGVVPTLINDQLAGGLCVPEDTQAGVHYCYETQGECSPGCNVDISLNQTQFVATNDYTLTVRLDLAANATIPAEASGFEPCYLFAAGDHLFGDADIELVPDPTTGQLTVTVAQIRNIDLSRLEVTGSDGFCSGASAFAGFVKTYFAQQIADFITPKLNEMIAGLLPDPLGLEGVLTIGGGALEARLVPGGYATVFGNSQLQITGATLGVITGINSDRDPSTRGSDASEPALCVPPILPPVPALETTSRGTYVLPAAPGFSGSPDPLGRDLSIGISETLLDLAGHHAVASGAACLGIGTAMVPQLNVGTFGVLVPSVAELASDEGNDPLLLVTRPQRAIDVSIGDNEPGSPALTLHISDLEVDVYPFLFERYTRAFTMSATLDVGVNVDFTQTPEGTWQATPTLVGISASDVAITVLNSDFIAEPASQLESTLPSVFNLLASQLTIPVIDLPTFAGFQIGSPSVTKVVSPDGDFLAINANLDTAPPAPVTQDKLAAHAALHSVDVPTPGTVPTITVDVDPTDAHGRALEWSWRIGTGIWHAYSPASPLVIRDPAFLWQGAYDLQLVARVQGDAAARSAITTLPITIDSVGPRLVASKTGWRGDDYVVRAFDVVAGENVRIAFGEPGDSEPRTAWSTGPEAALSAPQDTVQVFVEDPQGNRTVALIEPFHGQAGQAGCSCNTGGGSGASTWLLAVATMLVMLGSPRGRHRRHRRR
jgi:hypothetical protein